MTIIFIFKRPINKSQSSIRVSSSTSFYLGRHCNRRCILPESILLLTDGAASAIVTARLVSVRAAHPLRVPRGRAARLVGVAQLAILALEPIPS